MLSAALAWFAAIMGSFLESIRGTLATLKVLWDMADSAPYLIMGSPQSVEQVAPHPVEHPYQEDKIRMEMTRSYEQAKEYEKITELADEIGEILTPMAHDFKALALEWGVKYEDLNRIEKADKF